MTSPESEPVTSQRPPMSAGERRWFLSWSVATALVLLAVFLSGYHFPRYEMELREIAFGQIPSSCDRGFMLSRMTTHYVAWIICFFGGLAFVSSYWRVRWLIPFAALIPAALLASTQLLISTGMRQVERRIDAYDLSIVDRWLEARDSMLRGEDVLVNKAYVEKNKDGITGNLEFAFVKKDPGAPARFVLLGLLDPQQPVSASRAPSFRTMTGAKLPTVRSQGGEEFYTAADLYFWWQDNKGKYPSIPLLDDWLQRESTTTERIPEFEKARATRADRSKEKSKPLDLSEAIAGGQAKVTVDASYFPGRMKLTVALKNVGARFIRFDGPFLATPTGKTGPSILLYKKLKHEQPQATGSVQAMEWMTAAMFLKPPVAAYANLSDFTVTKVSASDPALRLLTPAILAGDFDPCALEVALWVTTTDVDLGTLRESIYQLDSDRPGSRSSLSSRKEPESHVHDSEILDRAFEILRAAGLDPSKSKLWQETEQALQDACQPPKFGTYNRSLIFFYTRKEAQQAMIELYRKPVGPEPKLGPMDEARSMRSDLLDYRECILRKFKDAARLGPECVSRGHLASDKLNWKNCAGTLAQLLELESNPARKWELKDVQQKFLMAITAAKK